MDKNRMLLRWLAVLGIMLAFAAFGVVTPLLIAYPPLGKSVLLAIPPNLFIALTWMAGAWYAAGKNPRMAVVLTVGMMPVRLAFFGAWIWLVSHIPGLNIQALLICMMMFWGLFTIPEVAMLVSFSQQEDRERRSGSDDSSKSGDHNSSDEKSTTDASMGRPS